MNWGAFVTKVPALIQGAMSIVQHVKSAKGAEKKEAVLAAIPEALTLAEFGAGKDLLNDPAVADLVSAYVDAEAAAMKAKAALQAGLRAKQPA